MWKIEQNRRKTGALYEKQAAEYLKQQGYVILECNYWTRFGEIDIIAKKDDGIVFVEVKYRKNTEKGYPQEAVSKQKQRKIYRSANVYLYQKGWKDKACRFDVIAILGDEIEHIKNAFFG